ncbi:vesicle-associated membrane protein 3 isoform X2 [Varanus komodoensis]|uniref:Vesicle associated membrane protein 3 n=1 Tax=Varanus komodoensis TaxID=61221 RepID=A0A8D2LHZ1_VARKO|nr:vesicle-associated membrane protein 3 isoform X2 [Varanus komodoensis]
MCVHGVIQFYTQTGCCRVPFQKYLLWLSLPHRSSSSPAGLAFGPGSNLRLQQTQHQVDEVVDIMRVNVGKVLERDQKLSELDDRADALQAGASQFESNAAKLKRKYWWKNCKMWAILIAVVVILLIIIIVWSTSS